MNAFKLSIWLPIIIVATASAAWLNHISPPTWNHYNKFAPTTLRTYSEDSDSVDWISESRVPATRSKDPGDTETDEDLGDVQIPSTGISVMDDLEAERKDRFFTELVPITGLNDIAAQIVTTATSGTFEVVRYIVALSPPNQCDGVSSQDLKDLSEESNGRKGTSFVMVDIPPYSAKLAAAIRAFVGPHSKLVAAFITSRDSIHYDDARAVFTTRRSDLIKWSDSFPGLRIIGYRLDIPRDCRESITQQLDGYGPFALHEDPHSGNLTFTETGRPLTFMEWDYDVAQAVLGQGKTPPDEEDSAQQHNDDEQYSSAAIRAREKGKRVLAVYTPGHTFGSVSYVFPETKICCSGFTIPVEDTRAENDYGMEGAGPALDCRGYITTSKAGLSRQMESARALVNQYADRFNVVFPSRGDPLYLDGDTEERQKNVFSILDQFEKIGKIYEQLGIISSEHDDDL